MTPLEKFESFLWWLIEDLFDTSCLLYLVFWALAAVGGIISGMYVTWYVLDKIEAGLWVVKVCASIPVFCVVTFISMVLAMVVLCLLFKLLKFGRRLFVS